MIKINNKVHTIIREHPVLDVLRKEAERGKELVVFRHEKTRQYILAETNERVVREIAVLAGWPRISSVRMRSLVAQLRPFPGRHRVRVKKLQKHNDEHRERARNAGRTMRELMANVRSKTKGTKKDHPSINWPKIKGEGV